MKAFRRPLENAGLTKLSLLGLLALGHTGPLAGIYAGRGPKITTYETRTAQKFGTQNLEMFSRSAKIIYACFVALMKCRGHGATTAETEYLRCSPAVYKTTKEYEPL